MRKKLLFFRTTVLLLFVLLGLNNSYGQLFQQQFATNLAAFSNSNSSNATYINTSTPSNAQFTYLGSSGTGSTISIASNKLTIARTGNGWGFARGVLLLPDHQLLCLFVLIILIVHHLEQLQAQWFLQLEEVLQQVLLQRP
jgi:hypothetical protein